jgi:Family of unknown function (DUF6533)
MTPKIHRLREIFFHPVTYYYSVAVAACTLWIYDIALTFRDEVRQLELYMLIRMIILCSYQVRLIWSSEWTMGKCLYLIVSEYGCFEIP